jgi:hypothetical protein
MSTIPQSTTPRTDAAVRLTIGAGFNMVYPSFARELENELADMTLRAEKAEERLKWLEGFLQAGGTSINTVSYYTVENHPDDTDETHFNFPFQIGISVETENRGCYEWVEFSNGAKGLCPAIDAAKIKYAEWQNKMHKGDNQ